MWERSAWVGKTINLSEEAFIDRRNRRKLKIKTFETQQGSGAATIQLEFGDPQFSVDAGSFSWLFR
ncbi:MAG TPA: hypothetical protein VIB39_08245 [Candidatus Angelobacter sp.]|jgi:hypothetical protein